MFSVFNKKKQQKQPPTCIPTDIQDSVNRIWRHFQIFYSTGRCTDLSHELDQIPNLGEYRKRQIIMRLKDYRNNQELQPGPNDERYVKMILTAVALGNTDSSAFWASLALNNGQMNQYGNSVELSQPYPIAVSTEMLLYTVVDKMAFDGKDHILSMQDYYRKMAGITLEESVKLYYGWKPSSLRKKKPKDSEEAESSRWRGKQKPQYSEVADLMTSMLVGKEMHCAINNKFLTEEYVVNILEDPTDEEKRKLLIQALTTCSRTTITKIDMASNGTLLDEILHKFHAYCPEHGNMDALSFKRLCFVWLMIIYYGARDEDRATIKAELLIDSSQQHLELFIMQAVNLS
ncbi:hypothetical protein FPQ18DRAFT_401124 [Pyronema domesticum]|nr:hypothetical protein FPQ18DRAFT_401124 [Pyronema domesticum]